jgi:hypothetical protein
MEMCVLSYASLNKEKTQDRHPNFYRRQDALRTTIVGKYSDKKKNPNVLPPLPYPKNEIDYR